MAGKKYYRMREAADYLNLHTGTVRKYTDQGKIKSLKTPAGQRVYTLKDLNDFLGVETSDTSLRVLAYYARDSRGSQSSIDNQLKKLANEYGDPVKTYTDKASGLNENRKGLARLIRDARAKKFNTLAITNTDRLTRFGYSYLVELFTELNIQILVLDDPSERSPHEELLQDFMSLLASFSGKYYKLRGLKQSKQLLTRAGEELDKT